MTLVCNGVLEDLEDFIVMSKNESGKVWCELAFELPSDELDPFELSDVVYAAGLADPVIGTGNPRFLYVCFEYEGDCSSVASNILGNLPEDSKLYGTLIRVS